MALRVIRESAIRCTAMGLEVRKRRDDRSRIAEQDHTDTREEAPSGVLRGAQRFEGETESVAEPKDVAEGLPSSTCWWWMTTHR